MVQRTIPTSAARVASWAEQQPHPDTGSHPELPVGPPHEPAPSKLTGKHYLAHRCPLNSRTVSRRAVGMPPVGIESGSLLLLRRALMRATLRGSLRCSFLWGVALRGLSFRGSFMEGIVIGGMSS